MFLHHTLLQVEHISCKSVFLGKLKISHMTKHLTCRMLLILIRVCFEVYLICYLIERRIFKAKYVKHPRHVFDIIKNNLVGKSKFVISNLKKNIFPVVYWTVMGIH